MRKINLILMAVALIVGFSSCNSKKDSITPDEIGNGAFEVLKNFDAKGKQGFVKNFMTIEDVRDLGKNTKVIPDVALRNELTSMDKDVWNDNISNSYNSIKDMEVDNNINWKKIEYSDFVYKIKHEEKVPMNIEGVLIFMSDGREYKVDTYSMWNGKKYVLFKMDQHK